MTVTPSKSCAILLCIFLICSTIVSAEKNLIHFKELNPSETRSVGKKVMVSFTADWCLPCKIMKSSLYNDPEIAALVNENFQPVLIDVDSPLGETWHKTFNIDMLPSILFTSPSGIEFERIKATPSKQEFLTILKRIIKTDKVPYRAHNHSTINTEITNTVIESSLENVEIDKSIFDIQLGAFSTLVSAEKRLNALNVFRQEKYFILYEDTNGKMLYKVVHQGLGSEKLCASILKQYLQHGFEAFVRPQK